MTTQRNPLARKVVEVKLMIIAAANIAAAHNPAQARSYCERLVWIPFLDFEWDEGLLDIRPNEDRHFAPYYYRKRYLTSVRPLSHSLAN